jgi:probable HAF family extracellular repeat protein
MRRLISVLAGCGLVLSFVAVNADGQSTSSPTPVPPLRPYYLHILLGAPGTTAGGGGSEAYAVSAGGVVVGTETSGSSEQACEWLLPTAVGPGELAPIPIGGTSTSSVTYAASPQMLTGSDVLTPVGANNGQACLFGTGSSTYIPNCPGAAYGINDLGHVVGQDFSVSQAGQAFLYSGGAPSLIETAPSAAYGINNAGQVVGTMGAVSGASGTSAFLYSGTTISGAGTGTGTPVVLPGADASANAIDNYASIAGGWNDVVGYANSTTGVSQACLWTSRDTIKNLGSLPGIGASPTAAFPSSAQAVMSVPTVALGAVTVTGANVVGWSNTTLGGNQHAFLWTSATGAMYDLNNLTRGSGWTLNSATGINANGWIVGDATNNVTGQSMGFLLTPLPSVLYGDAVLNGTVDINDLTVVLANYGQTGMTWSQGEFTGSGTVDINDLTVVLANYGQTAGSAGLAGPVPEPATIALLLAAAACLAAIRRRR